MTDVRSSKSVAPDTACSTRGRRPSSIHQHSYRARRDELTGLASRSLFVDRITAALSQPHVTSTPFAVLFINLDRFTWANDALGREGGDAVLRGVATRLRQVTSGPDTVARIDGDEFGIVCPTITDADAALELAALVSVALDPPFTFGTEPLFVTASIGIRMSHPGETASAVDVMRDATVAMRRVRSRGGAGSELFTESMRVNYTKRAGIDHALHQALDEHQLLVHYQPVVQLASGRITGMEALVRWDHPEWGMVPPIEFIPVAESSGVINAIGDYVMTEALAQAAAWERMAGPHLAPTVAINLSARQFLNPRLAGHISDLIAAAGVNPERICFEITESVLMDDLDSTIASLRSLKDLGVGLAVDDFGTGYSSLAYLKRFPVDSVKVDRSFINGLGIDAEDSAIVQAVIGMSKALRLATVAEGVETEAQVMALQSLGCDIGQGYHFSRPQPAAALHNLVATGGVLP